MALTKRMDMWMNDVPPKVAEPIGYEVLGLRPGRQAYIRIRRGGGWELLTNEKDERSMSRGIFATPDDALAHLEAGW